MAVGGKWLALVASGLLGTTACGADVADPTVEQVAEEKARTDTETELMAACLEYCRAPPAD